MHSIVNFEHVIAGWVSVFIINFRHISHLRLLFLLLILSMCLIAGFDISYLSRF